MSAVVSEITGTGTQNVWTGQGQIITYVYDSWVRSGIHSLTTIEIMA